MYRYLYSLNRSGGLRYGPRGWEERSRQMTTRAIGSAAVFLLAVAIGACTRVGHIQRNEPVRMMKFAGSHEAAAQCIQQRLGGKLQTDSAERLVVYDSVKGRQAEGITHYAVTVGKAPEKGSFAELRVVRPAPAPGPGVPPASRVPSARDAINEYWTTVQDCAAQAKAAS